jgi:GH25 family lysozyme M1 (1,4-beta-N-acetylmuramidase)
VSDINARGIDIAAIDGNTTRDWVRARDEGGVRFAYVKRSQHVYTDAQYASSTEGARAAGLRVGAYILPGWGPRAAPAKTQVSVFKTAPGAIIPGTDLPPALDVESGIKAGFAGTGYSPAQLVEQVRQHVLEMQAQLGAAPVIYTSWNQWYDLGLPAAPWAAECPLWIKTAYRLRAHQPVDTAPPAEPHVGPNAADPKDYNRVPDTWKESGWFAQQYQGDAIGVPGFNATADVSRFQGARRGDTGPHVMWLQRALNRTGGLTSILVDGDFGAATEAALRLYQGDRGLAATAELDLTTFCSLSWRG